MIVKKGLKSAIKGKPARNEQFRKYFHAGLGAEGEVSLSSVVFSAGAEERAREEWHVRYCRNKRAWKINSEYTEETDKIELSFKGDAYYLALAHPNEEYLFEIEEIARVIGKTKRKEATLGQIFRAFITSYGVASKDKEYYRGVLKRSTCFIEMKLQDAFNNKVVIWKVNKTQIVNFRKMKASTLVVLVEVAEQNQTLSMFYRAESDGEQKIEQLGE